MSYVNWKIIILLDKQEDSFFSRSEDQALMSHALTSVRYSLDNVHLQIDKEQFLLFQIRDFYHN